MKKQKFTFLGLGFFILVGGPLQSQINDGGSLPKSFAQAGIAQDPIPTFLIPDIDHIKIAAEDKINDASGLRAPRFGVLVPVNISWSEGKWSTLSNGDRIWQLKIRAVNAKATNYYFDDFYMPPGAKLHIFSPDRSEMIGGFGSHNNSDHFMFSTALIHGDEAVIEYYEPLEVAGQGRIRISDVNHAYRMVEKPQRATKRDFGNSDVCQVNVNCSPEGDGKTQQRDAVARILVRAGQEAGWCTGTMINNVRQDCKPYFLTALHCADDGNGNIIPQNDFDQWVFYFNYQAAGCTNPNQEADVPNNTITGANVRAHSTDPTIATGSDLLLLEFQNAVPANYNVYYAGWNRNTAATMGGFGIHHPAGDIKKISTFTVTTATTGWNQNGVTHWSLTWSQTTNGHGVTEGGSSGSGLFDSNGLLIGSLSGGSSFCNATDGGDSYGKMSHHWDQNGATATLRLKDWLDPDNTGVMTLQGTYFPCEMNPGCDPMVNVNTATMGNTLASGSITTTGTVLVNGVAVFSAPTVNLNGGFEVPAGNCFEVNNVGCSYNGTLTCEGGGGAAGTCASPHIITCGQIFQGSNSGGQSNWSAYSVNFTGLTGPEKIHTLVIPGNTTRTINLTGLTADLDLMVATACDPNNVIAGSASEGTTSEAVQITNNNSNSVTIHIIVDGWNGAVSTYSLSCN